MPNIENEDFIKETINCDDGEMKKKVMISLIMGILFIIMMNYFIDTENDVSILEENKFLMIAHRGASLDAPEHTLESYKLASENKADYIEIDLQLTSDDVLVAMHDESVDRTTNGTGEVSNLTLDEIKQLDAGIWFDESFEGLSVPTLEDIIQEFSDNVNYYIETKFPENDFKMEEVLIEVLEDYKLLENVSSANIVIQSFSEESLKAIQDLNNEIPLIQLQGYENDASITDEKLNEISEYAVGLGVNYKSLTKEFIDKVLSHGMFIHGYTVNESDDIEHLKKMGVNGVFTDNIEVYEE